MKWVAAQNALSEPFLDSLPARPYFERQVRVLRERLAPGVVRKQGPYWLTRERRSDGGSVFVVQDDLDEPKRMLLATRSVVSDEDATVDFVQISPDGRYAAYTIASGGSDRMEVRIRDLVAGRDIPDRIEGLKFDPPIWTGDSGGLVYYRYRTGDADGVDRESTVFFHALGTGADADRVLARSDPGEVGATSWAQISHDGRFLIVIDDYGGQQRLSVMDLGNPLAPRFDGPLVRLSDDRDATTRFIGHIGGTLYLHTSRDAPNYRVVAVELSDPTRWRTVPPESRHLLQHTRIVGGRLVAAYLRDVKNELETYALDGTDRRAVPLPAPGSAFYLSGDPDDSDLTFAFDAFAYPLTTFGYDVRTGEIRSLGSQDFGHDPGEYETEQIFFSSRDGTRVPMFVVHRADIILDGRRPTLLYGYGASGAVESPIFRDEFFAWIAAGGVLAVANVRGGGEYGESWERAGMLDQKQNSYDDFIAAAETLIREEYTSPAHLAALGESNGGMLVGAVMTQRPELFAAALPVVGVLDALRFPSFTAGPRWATSHGDPAEPEGFKWLSAWSPLHRIQDGACYPPTLITTALNDDLVHPSQSYKFAARLQVAQGCARPAILRVYPSGAHDILFDGETQADILAFAAFYTGLKPSPPR
jgi:prolyl oligopeptidase